MYDIQLLVDGRAVTKYQHNGETYVEGRRNSQYKLKLINNSNSRAEFVVSVDGLSIVNGEQASADGTGWLVNARSSIVVEGWLINTESVAAFKFSDKGKSYSAQSDQGTQNVGVIGLAVYSEKEKEYHQAYPLPYYPDSWYPGTMGPTHRLETWCGIWEPLFGSSASDVQLSSQAFNSSIGTEFGQEIKQATQQVNFNRSHKAPVIKTIYYGDARDLNKLGIVLDWQKPKTSTKPNPFPADFCKPPKNWKPNE